MMRLGSMSFGTLLMLSVACGGEDSGRGTAPTPVPVATATPTAPPAPTVDTRPLPEPVRLAREQAAEDAGLPPEQVEVIEFSEEQWPSAALGCPKPGMYYAQVITPGYRVVVRVGDDTVPYHTDMDGNAIRCEP
jgi:hypothetical protein